MHNKSKQMGRSSRRPRHVGRHYKQETEDTDPMGCILRTALQKRLERERMTLSWLVSVIEAAGGDLTV